MQRRNFAVLTLCLLAGCKSWMKHDDVKPTDNKFEQQGVTSEKLVSYLNKQAAQLNGIESERIDITARVEGKRMPALIGFMACEKPKSFRLTGDVIGTQRVDFGSNNDLFWFWVKDAPDPSVYFCAYKDFEQGVKLPFPFQPEWVIQALGMAEFDPTKSYKLDTKKDTYELSEETTTAQGVPVKKITVFERQTVAAPKPQVRSHIVMDARTNKIICQADIGSVRVGPAKMADGTVKNVAYPNAITLSWPSEQLTMELKLGGRTELNPQMSAEKSARFFTLPSMPNVPKVDLAKATRIPAQPTSNRPIMPAGGFRNP